MDQPTEKVRGDKRSVSEPSQKNKIVSPTFNTLSTKNLKRIINFHPNEIHRCRNSWYQDIGATHVRNKRLLDLTRERPKCCSDIYNIIVDRQKLKKLKKFGLSKQVRTLAWNLELEENGETCKPKVEERPDKIISVDCAQIPEADSEDDEDYEEQELDLEESEKRCSECYTLGEKRKKIKEDWKDLLHGSENEYCKGVVREILGKYKGSWDAELKLGRS